MSATPCQLSDLIEHGPAVTISGMTLDSRQVRPGDLFVALAGVSSHGLKHVDQALERGCAAVLWEYAEGQLTPELAVPQLGVEGLSQKISGLAGRYYGNPSHKLTVIAVTGTNGKSSCVEFIAQGLQASGYTVGTLGTLGSGVLGQTRKPLGLTTPDPITVQRELAQLLAAGCSHVAMEVSSHGLDQSRIAGLRVDVALVTNVSRDHLDYHGTMARYMAAKARLLTDFQPAAAILNRDDDAFSIMRESLFGSTQLISFGFSGGELSASQLEFTAKGCQFQLRLAGSLAPVSSSLIGQFNVANALAAGAVLMALGVCSHAQQLATLMADLKPPPGRMQLLSKPGQPLVVVDYAHTPDALENALGATRKHCQGTLFCVFGCGGDRDQGKRPLMGAVALAHADQIVVTSDNPRSEAPDKIISDILAGQDIGDNVIAIADRRQAIAHALQQASQGDAVLVAGKGHETWQDIGTSRLPFDDTQVVSSLLEACA